ncbi:MAG: NDP-sugar synthase [Endomicrobium sp.]|jgi:mannose-1-phosphate guanylyltransferase/phosphomannomutase|nr:NDP-sugar synthase [Endomicrobium sp.]
MKAFVLAAGIGTRLSPLTTSIPKPMIPILGKPVLYYTFSNLYKNGIDDVFVNVHYQHSSIMNFFKENKTDVKLKFSREKKLLGTAGAIKNKENFFDDTFVVMSGDGLTDINLKKVINFHKERMALVTIVLKKINLRFDYGIAVADKNGKIKSFVEKPFWGDIFNNNVNTGIYIFEPEVFKFIPKNKFFDFSTNLFPLLMNRKQKIYGYEMEEYWIDIGNIFEYKKGVFDVLDEKVKIRDDIKSKTNKYISVTAQIDKSVKIHGPCYIGSNVVIEKNTIIGAYSVISDDVKIGNNVFIEKSIIWKNVRIGGNVKITNSILGNNAVISNNITLFDSVVMEYFK